MPGALPTIWCSLKGLTKIQQRGIVQPFILFMQIATLVYFSKLGILASATWATFLWCVPAPRSASGCSSASTMESSASLSCCSYSFPAPH